MLPESQPPDQSRLFVPEFSVGHATFLTHVIFFYDDSGLHRYFDAFAAAQHRFCHIDLISRACHKIVVRIPSDTQGDSRMAESTHLAELEQRHRMLEAELAEALQHPSTDDCKLTELKRRKLRVKDEIARLTRASVH
jgi:hypothetical protein